MLAASRGERAAFAALVERHQAELYALFRRLGADGHSAEDCVQDTFLRLLRAHAAWTPRAPFRAFLLVLARNAFIDQCRRRRARPAEALPTGEDAGGAADALRLPGGHAPQDVRDALAALPEKQRLVVQLNLWQGLRYQEIAATLDVPEGTVKSRMFHALARLRKVLQRDHLA